MLTTFKGGSLAGAVVGILRRAPKLMLAVIAAAISVPALAADDVNTFALASGTTTPSGGAGLSRTTTAGVTVNAAGGLDIEYFSSNPTLVSINGVAASSGTPLTVHVAKNTTTNNATLTFPSAPATATVVTITARKSGGTARTFNLTIQPFVTGITLSAEHIAPPKTITGTVSVTEAPATNTVIQLSSSNACANPGTSVTVLAGQTTSNVFTINTTLVATNQYPTITATKDANSVTSTPFEVRAAYVRSLTADATEGTIGDTITGTVTLTGPTAENLTVTLTANLPCSVPASIVIPAGQMVGTFPITLNSVPEVRTAKIYATTTNSTLRRNVSIANHPAFTVTLDSASVAGGAVFGGTINLYRPAGLTGVSISMALSNKWGILNPTTQTVIIPFGATQGLFFGVTKPTVDPHNVVVSATGLSHTATRKFTITP